MTTQATRLVDLRVVFSRVEVQVLDREKEVIVMLHKIGRLEEALREYTDFRQVDAEQFTEWGKADHYNAEARGAGAASTSPGDGS